jgi:predicted DNA-binding protein (MmcQ/YjbR family)
VNVDSIRRFCLSFPDAKENLQWGETLCFKVRGKHFAMLSLDAMPHTLILKARPEEFTELLEREGIVPAPYVGRYKWVMLEQLDVLPHPELEELIRRSYEMVAAKSRVKRKARAKSLKKQSRSAKRTH